MRALFALLLAATAQAAPETHVWFLDVGQGDAAVIRSPTGKWVLMDAGPPQAGPRIAAFLQEKKAGPVDLAIVSHPHLDHVGGMAAVVSGVGLKLFMDPGYPHPLPQYEDLLRLIQSKAIPVKDAVAGRRVEIGLGAALEIVWPQRPFLTSTRSDVNSASVVARLVHGRRAVLFTGDIEAVVEEKLLDRGAAVQADVLKVAHHGSRHSSTMAFLRAVRPAYAVVSCAARNDYKHPHKEALERLEKVGARVLRVDLLGDVEVTTDGAELRVASAQDLAPASDSASPAARHYDVATRGPAVAQAAGAPQFAASARSPVFHRSGCPAVAKIKAHNLVYYKTRQEAAGAGKKPAQDCEP